MSTLSTNIFANRVSKVPQSFIREILKVASNPEITSFAGGLPNPDLFPIEELKESAANVFQNEGKQALQYASTEGLYPLREYISNRYLKRYNLNIPPEQILITNGSQQALDLIGKLIINPGDKVLVERPAYLGALQCFSMFEAQLLEVNLEHDGINIELLKSKLEANNVKLFYGIPNFQNPTGITYSEEKRKETANILSNSNTIFIEDDPYGEISFTDTIHTPIYSYLPEQTILLGSFSKTIAPGLRLGWMVAPKEIITKATILKQASDLHTGNLTQYILSDFLKRNDPDYHISKIIKLYQHQCGVIMNSLKNEFPSSVSYTQPEGGMFCWLSLPTRITSRELLSQAMNEKIIFVPGDTFYAQNPDSQTLRLNFSNVDETRMIEGLKKLGSLI
jgi:2-aminoadipate transaminase